LFALSLSMITKSFLEAEKCVECRSTIFLKIKLSN